MPSSTRTVVVRRAWIGAVTMLCGLWPAALSTPGAPEPLVASRQAAASELWLAPPPSKATAALGAAAADLAEDRAERALPVFAKATSHPVLGGYARLYQGRAELALDRHAAALASARQVVSASPGGALGEAALWLMADAAEAAERWDDVARALQSLVDLPSASVARAQLRLGRALASSSDRAAAARAFAAVYYGHPLTPEADEAGDELDKPSMPSVTVPAATALSRAEKLFAARRYTDARRAYDEVAGRVTGTDRALVDLRRAECDLHRGRYEAARTALRKLLDDGAPHAVEAAVADLEAVRGLGRQTEYVRMVRRFVDAHPDHPLAESVLNDLGTTYILADDDASAAAVFDEILERYPTGRFADRASWKAGWWAYRHDNYAKAATIFERASAASPRADYRPAWLYWAARAREHMKQPAAAVAGYERTIHFYRNSYYGRLAARRLVPLRAQASRAGATPAAFRPDVDSDTTRPPAGGHRPAEPALKLIEALLAAGLYDDAIAELNASARALGSSPYIEATIAYALNRKGQLRPAITAMRRAYPGFMAAGGETLPRSLLTVIFPIDHWDLLRRQADLRDLDPFLVAALVAQESTFQADIRSIANAWGLMQIIPGTGRRYAAKLGIPRFATRRLVDPEVNVRIGTAYLSDLVKRFGNVAHALAAYNAGENRVERWRAERPGLDTDEFVDDIPFPETQNYVKRILGTTEDYRLLYGTASASVRESGR